MKWKQVWGDTDPCRHGGVFMREDGEAIELRSLEPVRGLVGDREAEEVGYPFWSSQGYYDPDDLKWGSDAESVLRSIGAEADDENWYKLSRVERAVLLFDYGVGKEPVCASTGQRSGGFTQDVLGDDLWLDTHDNDIRVGCFAEDDAFLQEIVGKFEVYVCMESLPGCLPDNEPFLMLGREAAATWVLERVEESYEIEELLWTCDECGHEVIEEVLTCPSCGDKVMRSNLDRRLDEWRSSPFAATTTGMYSATASLYHTFDSGDGPSSESIGMEASDTLIEAYNEGTELARFIEESELSEEALELLVGAPQ